MTCPNNFSLALVTFWSITLEIKHTSPIFCCHCDHFQQIFWNTTIQFRKTEHNLLAIKYMYYYTVVCVSFPEFYPKKWLRINRLSRDIEKNWNKHLIYNTNDKRYFRYLIFTFNLWNKHSYRVSTPKKRTVDNND